MNYGYRTGDINFAERYFISDMPTEQLRNYILSLKKVKYWIDSKIIYEVKVESLVKEKGYALVRIKVKNGDENTANSFFCELENKLLYAGTSYITLYLKLKKLNVMFKGEQKE